ncbi:PHP domain-containing protein [Amycolatopsis sp. cg9]|uniref:PHP domain-containing protein n=1 Tax=Amycolatopsis sp. cg9 TaxID=3238801 RepID=UPI003526169B
MLARPQEGYHRLCRVIFHAQIAGGEKGRPLYNLEEVVDELAGHVVVLTGCRKGPVRRALAQHGRAAARAELERLVDWFGHSHVAVELINHRLPLDDAANDALDDLARELRLPTVVSNTSTTPPPPTHRSPTRSPRSGRAGRPRTSRGGGRRPGRRSCGRGWSSGAERPLHVHTSKLTLVCGKTYDLEGTNAETYCKFCRTEQANGGSGLSG